MSAHDITKLLTGSSLRGPPRLACLSLFKVCWPLSTAPFNGPNPSFQRLMLRSNSQPPPACYLMSPPQVQKQPRSATINRRRFSSGATHLSLVPVITTLRLRAASTSSASPREPRHLFDTARRLTRLFCLVSASYSVADIPPPRLLHCLVLTESAGTQKQCDPTCIFWSPAPACYPEIERSKKKKKARNLNGDLRPPIPTHQSTCSWTFQSQ
ncbi:hypothetical protein LY78DRAFT_211022 [Colletotrichum sublineola]|nr:hypothetical protein LY78DRAFT_211022 [Colletotrichum sublineola]